MGTFRIKALASVILFLTSIATTPITIAEANSSIPESLQEWIPWVLKESPSIKCPILYNQNSHYCAYPSKLIIEMGNKSGKFNQTWDIYGESWIVLPGGIKNWPQNVRVNNEPRPVISRNEQPSIQLNKGRYTITGEFHWQQRPKSLSIANDTGLVELTLDNKKVVIPDFRQGKLWLKTTDTTPHQNNRLNIQIFRKITDSIPLQITTQIKLDVSGQQREITLDGALLNGFSPSAVNSRLPAQLDKDGKLKLQVRPGQWTVDITAYNQQQSESIELPTFTMPWPTSEIWVLNQQTQLRLIKVIDKNNIDPNQTQLPSRWKTYPAYTMQAGEKLLFKVIKRGNPDPEPDQISLTKKIWLDFDGSGLTVNDKLTGALSK